MLKIININYTSLFRKISLLTIVLIITSCQLMSEYRYSVPYDRERPGKVLLVNTDSIYKSPIGVDGNFSFNKGGKKIPGKKKVFIEDKSPYMEFKKNWNQSNKTIIPDTQLYDPVINIWTETMSDLKISYFKKRDVSLVYGHKESKCLIYYNGFKEKNSTTDWSFIGSFFDMEIYPNIVEAMGEPSDIDNNGKIILVYYYPDNDVDHYGHIIRSDVLNDLPFNNKGEYLYMIEDGDTYPFEDCLNILAHEFTHLIILNQRHIKNNLSELPTWLDEGIAEAGSVIGTGYTGATEIMDIIDYDENHLLRNGFGIFKWSWMIENYALGLSFMEFCRSKYIGEQFYMKLLNSKLKGSDILEKLIIDTNSDRYNDFSSIVVDFYKDKLLNPYLNIYQPSEDINSINPGGAIYLDLTTKELNEFMNGFKSGKSISLEVFQ